MATDFFLLKDNKNKLDNALVLYFVFCYLVKWSVTHAFLTSVKRCLKTHSWEVNVELGTLLQDGA